MHHKPTWRKRAMMLMAQKLAKAANSNYQPQSFLRRTLGALLELAGFAFLIWAGYQINSVAGTAIAAASCFVLAAHVQSGKPVPEPDAR